MNETQHMATLTFLNSFDADKQIKGARIYDSGSGDGFASMEFLSRGAAHVVQYDPLRYSSEIHSDSTRISCLKDDVIIPDHFDLVWSHHVVEHVNDPVDYLCRLRQSMKPSGELWLGCPNMLGVTTFSDGHIHNFTIATLLLVLEKAAYPIQDAMWWVLGGQIRLRIPGLTRRLTTVNRFPEPMEKLLKLGKHFDVGLIAKKWRW